MRQFAKLFHHEFTKHALLLWLACAGLILSQAALVVLFIRTDYAARELRFEHIYARSGAPVMLIVMLAAYVVWVVMRAWADYAPAKSIYTLLSLPVRRESLYLSKLSAMLAALFVLAAAAYAAVFVCYLAYLITMPQAASHTPMTNGLLLAFTRGDVLRALFPLRLSGLLANAALIISVPILAFTGFLMTRTREYVRPGISMLVILFNIAVTAGRALYVPLQDPPGFRVGLTALAVLLNAYLIYYGMRAYRRAAMC